ncbi:MAG: LytTR family DNA-binding domain-containing protein [Chryseolinea sp.]
MKILILEDEERSGKYLADLVVNYDAALAVVAILPSAKSAVHWLKKNVAPDLILMDIHLEDALVFQIFDEVKITVPVIFTTAYDQYAIRAFKVNSIDYLLKPIQPDELGVALDKYKSMVNHFKEINYRDILERIGQRSPMYKERFMITAGTKITSIESKQVAYFILESKVTHLITHAGQKMVVNFNLDELVDVLEPSKFFRINRQFIVSLEAVVSAQVHSSGRVKLQLAPPSKTEVLVSGDRIVTFKEWMGK